MKLTLCVIEGDGVGQEVVPSAVAVLKAVLPNLETFSAPAGWKVFQETGEALPSSTIELARRAGAVLFGAVASPSFRVPGYRSPIVALRRELDVYANLRPTTSGLGCPHDVDLIVVRENTEGLYVGRERLEGDHAIAERLISRKASERVARTAFELARKNNRRKLTVIHKANILPITDGLFRESVLKIAGEYEDIVCDEMLVDTAGYWLGRDPGRFDILLAPNMYGDILSDIAAAWGGGLGMAASLSLGESCALAEPVHGSAPDIAGQGVANPVGCILSAAMLARIWWRRNHQAEAIEQAVRMTLQAGISTRDLARGDTAVSTQRFTREVLDRLSDV